MTRVFWTYCMVVDIFLFSVTGTCYLDLYSLRSVDLIVLIVEFLLLQFSNFPFLLPFTNLERFFSVFCRICIGEQ